MLYDFHCGYCKKTTEMSFSMHEVPPQVKCPICTHTAKRVYSMPQVVISNWIVGRNADEDFERGCDLYNKRLYSEDEQKQPVNKQANLGGV